MCVCTSRVCACRSPTFRYAFAAAVGKRHYSERLNSIQKAAIIEHHRSVQWSEQEYAKLYQLVQQNQQQLRTEMFDAFNPDDPMFYDYCHMLTLKIYRTAEEQAAWGELPNTGGI